MTKPKYDNIPPSTLIISRNSSYCNNCGLGADPTEPYHKTELGYGAKDRACGIEWTHVTSDFYGMGLPEGVREDRPDLTFIKIFDITEGIDETEAITKELNHGRD